MARSLLAVLLVALALGAQARQPLGIFDSIGEIASSAVGTVKDTATGAAGTVADTATGGFDAVKGFGADVIDKVKGAFTSAKDFVECNALDWTVVDLEPCYQAPESDLCPAPCKANIDQFPDNCITRIVGQVEADGNAQYADRLKRQFAACGRDLFGMAPAPAPEMDWMAAAADIAGQPAPSA